MGAPLGTELFEVAPKMTKDLSALFVTKQRDIPQINANPPSYRIPKGPFIEKNSVPVILRSSLDSATGGSGGDITPDLVWTLHFVDARLRVYNYLLYRENNRISGRETSSTVSNFFKAIYVPSIGVNPLYYWTDILGLNLQIISPEQAGSTQNPLNMGKITLVTMPSGTANLRINFVGAPIDVKANYTFTILMIKFIIDKVKKVNGTFISLWHNESLSEKWRWKGWRIVYDRLLEYAS